MALFDSAAKTYDEEFSQSKIGKLQRKLVYHYFKKSVLKGGLNILELNCGTGIDAQWMAKFGNKVIATDISPEMVSIAKNKNTDRKIRFDVLDFTDFNNSIFTDDKYDIVFSNFGGLNCVDDFSLKSFSQTISRCLKPNGKFVSVIMSENCWIEKFYFFLKGKNEDLSRRKKKPLMVNVNGRAVSTWYFTPNNYQNLFNEQFRVSKILPVGFLVPPSYMSKGLKPIESLLQLNYNLEILFAHAETAAIADHFYIEMIKN